MYEGPTTDAHGGQAVDLYLNVCTSRVWGENEATTLHGIGGLSIDRVLWLTFPIKRQRSRITAHHLCHFTLCFNQLNQKKATGES